MTGQRCAWPGCPVIAQHGRLMCYRHWVSLPKRLRTPIWEHYAPGQTALTCTPEYRAALREVLAYARCVNTEAEAEHQRAEADQETLW